MRKQTEIHENNSFLIYLGDNTYIGIHKCKSR